MRNRCKAVGVGIIVDALINHMTNFPSRAWVAMARRTEERVPRACTRRRTFTPPRAQRLPECGERSGSLGRSPSPDLNTAPALGAAEDRGLPGRPGAPWGRGLPDLCGQAHPQVDLDEILYRVNTTLGGRGGAAPYVFLEFVGTARANACAPGTTSVRVTAWGRRGHHRVHLHRRRGASLAGWAGQRIAQLNPERDAGQPVLGDGLDLMPPDKAVVFLQNHDTQHTCGLGYRDGDTFRPANVRTLAQPHGYPSIRSSYAFDCPLGNSMAPPSDAAGYTNDVGVRDEPGGGEGGTVGLRAPGPARSGAWCGSVERWQGRTSITGGITGPTRLRSHGGTRGSSPSTARRRRSRRL